MTQEIPFDFFRLTWSTWLLHSQWKASNYLTFVYSYIYIKCCPLLFHSSQVFHNSVSWRSLSWVQVTASLHHYYYYLNFVCLFVCLGFMLFFFYGISIFTNPSARAGYDTRSIFKQSLTGFNSEFSFSKTSCLTKAEEPSLPYYLPIAGGRIIGFIPFPRVLDLNSCRRVHFRRR